jgi:bifunctional DNA-binding transcriptional regulator/antitoxin component of YhaV-PrlF toxin-antitoxin module
MGEVFVARVIADGKVTVPHRVRDVLGIEIGDYVRVTVTEVIKRQEQRKGERAGKKRGLSRLR